MDLDEFPEDDNGSGDAEAELNALMTKVGETFEPMGLYLTAGQFQLSGEHGFNEGPPLKERLKNGDQVVMNVAFRVGDLAWTERILDPEAHASKKEFEMIAPSEEEIELEAIMERFKATGRLDEVDDED